MNIYLIENIAYLAIVASTRRSLTSTPSPLIISMAPDTNTNPPNAYMASVFAALAFIALNRFNLRKHLSSFAESPGSKSAEPFS